MFVPGISALITEQEGVAYPSREEIERLQLEKLNRLLPRLHERRGFYRDLPESLGSLGELSSLPFTEDRDLAAEPAAFLLTSQAKVQRVITDRTSGTSGSAKRLFYTKGDCENTVRLFTAGLGELVYPGSTTMICMPFSGPYGLGELIAEAIRRLGARPLRVGSGRSYAELGGILESEKPDTYVGMPVPLLSMLRVCGKGSLRRALISGDACAESVGGSIEAILDTRLFPHYGSREMALGGAVTCGEHSGMHLRENHVIAEIVDAGGNVLPRGEFGELVITTIGMEAMPLIRYRTGDRTRLIPGICHCGCQALRLDSVKRINGDEILELDGRLFSIPDVVDYKASRDGDRLIIELLCLSDGCTEEIKKAAPANAELRLRKVLPEDRSLYPGKRTIL